MFDVSADLATISDAHTGGGHGGKGAPATWGSSTDANGSTSSSSAPATN